MPECSVEKFNLTMYYAPFFQNNCTIPCQSMRIYFAGYDGTNESDNEKQAYIRFYIEDQIPVKTSHLSYPVVQFLAEVGGYVGLLLGYSLMTLVEPIFNLILIIKKRCSNSSNKIELDSTRSQTHSLQSTTRTIFSEATNNVA